MSTISFPNPHGRDRDTPSSPSHSHSHSSSQHINFFPATYDPQASSSSFQINPLSSHPPRTPRTSIVTAYPGSNAYAGSASTYPGSAYPAELYSSTEEREERPLVMSMSVSEDENDSEHVDSRRRVRKEEVWREVLATSTGRDKALKLIQYSMRVYLLAHTSMRRTSKGRASWELQLFTRLEGTMGGLSLARKCLILFNWLTPLTSITRPQSLPFTPSPTLASTPTKPAPPAPLLHTFLHAPPPLLLDLVNSLSDDIATLSKLGLIGKRVGEKAGRLADWCWWSGTLVGLVEVGVEMGLVRGMVDEAESRLYASSLPSSTAPQANAKIDTTADEKELHRLRRQLYWLRISRAKLLMDLVFVSYECFRLKRARAPVMGFAGLLSAVLSSMKLYDRHKGALVKEMAH